MDSQPHLPLSLMNLQETIQGAPILQNHLPEGVAVHLEKFGAKFWVAKVKSPIYPPKVALGFFIVGYFFLIVKYRSPSILSGFTIFG